MVGQLTLDQPVVVRIHVREPTLHALKTRQAAIAQWLPSLFHLHITPGAYARIRRTYLSAWARRVLLDYVDRRFGHR
jgi:hypothetical protein